MTTIDSSPAPALHFPHAARLLMLVVLCSTTLNLSALEDGGFSRALASADAVANVRVTRLGDELRGDTVVQVVRFTISGRESGLAGISAVDVALPPAPAPSQDAPEQPVYAVGERYIVLLSGPDTRWSVAKSLHVADDGHVMAGATAAGLVIEPGADADAAVAAIAARLERRRADRERRATPPSARNQPWNLMRSSPLRRVWPFLPR